MWWLLWVVSILAVIGTKALTTKVLLREKFKLEGLLKVVSKIQVDERLARGNMELARRELAKIQGSIQSQEEAVEGVRERLKTFDEEKMKRLERAKHKLAN